MKKQITFLVFTAILASAATAQARGIVARMPAVIVPAPMLLHPGLIVPTSQIPSINIPNIVPSIGDLPLPVIPTPTLPLQSVQAPAAVFAADAPRSFGPAARVHAVAVPLLKADAGSNRPAERRDTVENRLRTRRLVEFVRDTLNLDDKTSLDELESAFDGRKGEDDRAGIVVLPERELEEELGLR
jgi:hypothetical protein